MSNGSNEYSDVAVQKLSMAVSSLTGVVEGLRAELTRSTVVAEQLMVRCGQLEAATKDLQKFLFTGNGQPALTQQIATIKTQLEAALSDLRDFDSSRISEKVFQAKLDQIEKAITSLQNTQKEMGEDREDIEKANNATRIQILLCVAGGIMGIISALVTAVATYLSSK